MAGILLIAHSPLASALAACVSHIYGGLPPQPVGMPAEPILNVAARSAAPTSIVRMVIDTTLLLVGRERRIRGRHDQTFQGEVGILRG